MTVLRKNMGHVLHFNTIFKSKLNRKCVVQLMISLSKHRDIQEIQDPSHFVVWFSSKFLRGLVAAAEIFWKICSVLLQT